MKNACFINQTDKKDTDIYYSNIPRGSNKRTDGQKDRILDFEYNITYILTYLVDSVG